MACFPTLYTASAFLQGMRGITSHAMNLQSLTLKVTANPEFHTIPQLNTLPLRHFSFSETVRNSQVHLLVKHNMYSWTAGLIRKLSNSKPLESLSIYLPHSPVHQLPLDLHNMRPLQRLTVQDIEPAAGFRLPPTCLLFLSKSYGGREQALQHASLAQAILLEVDGYKRSGPNIPLPLKKLSPHLRTWILTVWPDVTTPFGRMKHDVAD